MKEASYDLVRRWYETGDTSLLSDTIDWMVLESFPEGGHYVGRTAVADRFFPSVKAHFSEYITRPETFLTDGTNVATTGIYQVRTKSGNAGDIAFAHFWTVLDGEIVAFRQVADTAQVQRLLARTEPLS
jgi:uncharacterized protein